MVKIAGQMTFPVLIAVVNISPQEDSSANPLSMLSSARDEVLEPTDRTQNACKY